MSELSDALLDKAEESLAGALSEFDNGRYNNVANRAYYACFQAAVATLALAGIRPPGGKDVWGHAFVQAQFAGQLISRRKRFPAELRNVLSEMFTLRQQADYQRANVSRTQVTRSLSRARTFIGSVMSEA